MTQLEIDQQATKDAAGDLLAWFTEYYDPNVLMSGEPFLMACPQDSVPPVATGAVQSSNGGTSWVNMTLLTPILLYAIAGSAGGGTPGPEGPIGPQGPAGPAGPGIPAGGAAGDSLQKASATDFDTQWVAPA